MTHSANQRVSRLLKHAACLISACMLVSTFSGCTALTQPIDGVPADRLPPEFFPEPKADLVPVDISILSIEPPRDYQIAPGDILDLHPHAHFYILLLMATASQHFC